MASSFLGLYVQRDAIQLAQKSLDITGNNISNINSEGYTRQRLDVCAVARNGGSLGYNTKTQLAGQGADAVGVTQIRDKLLDTKVRKYNAELCDIGSKTTILSDIEDILDDVENSDTGLSAILGNWKATFQSFHATSADRTDLANIAKNAAESVINVMKNFETRINDVELTAKNDLDCTNTRINAILKDMAGINKQIEDSYVQMNDVYTTKEDYLADLDYGPLELKDQFNALADELSQYLNITVTETKTGSYTVELGDKTLVQKDKYAKTDIKFTYDKPDEITSPDGTTRLMRGFEKLPDRNEKGQVLSGIIPKGTKIYDADGNFTGLKADGNGGYVDEEGNETVVFTYGKNVVYYDHSGNYINGNAPYGTQIYDYEGNSTGVYADGIGGFVDYRGRPATVYTCEEGTKLYDEDGTPISGRVSAGIELYAPDKSSTGLFTDGKGGYVDKYGRKAIVYTYEAEPSFYDSNGNKITNPGDVNDGAVVFDRAGNRIKVNGSFDGECIQYTFSELYISSANTARGWDKARRELTPEIKDAGFGDMINKINSLLESSDVEEAYRLEKEIIAAAKKAGVEYNPVFLENFKDPEKAPEYVISVFEETDRLTGGSVKGLFDMFNGEGVYAGLSGNDYKGIKYYQETVRSLATSLEREFNGIFAEYNANNPDDTFEMFSFDGIKTVGNMKIADTWANNPLRCVHPEGTEKGDYNYDELSNKYLNKILSVFQKKNDFGTEPLTFTFEEFVTNYGNTIGSQLEYELSNFDSTTTMYNSVCEAREEVMGVSMGEEGVNMMNYQKWYNAISRMITAMDQCLDKLINNTGVVGL